MSGAARRPSDDSAAEALSGLLHALDESIVELECARTRARDLLDQHRAGRSWLEIVSTERRPLVVERISTVLATLSGVGSAWRRQEAHALHDEGVSINRIAALFGVTRQRVSALLREREAPPAGE